MKKVLQVLLVLIFLLLAAGAAAYFTGMAKFGTPSGTCRQDGNIPAAERKPLEESAMRFLQAVLAEDAKAARAMLTKEAHGSVSAENLTALSKEINRSAPYNNVQVEHVYLFDDHGSGPETRTICGTLSDGRWIAANIKPGSKQAHVVIGTKSRQSDWAFTVWLLPEDGVWKVQYFHMSLASMAGYRADQLLSMARQERDLGYAFNATLLYTAAQTVVTRGPAFQLGVQQDLDADLAEFHPAANLAQKPPFSWTMQGKTYEVSGVTVLGLDGKLSLIFEMPLKTPGSDDELEQRNRTFINAFLATHPEVTRTVKILVARLMYPDQRGGFGTIYEVGKGFMERKSPEVGGTSQVQPRQAAEPTPLRKNITQ